MPSNEGCGNYLNSAARYTAKARKRPYTSVSWIFFMGRCEKHTSLMLQKLRWSETKIGAALKANRKMSDMFKENWLWNGVGDALPQRQMNQAAWELFYCLDFSIWLWNTFREMADVHWGLLSQHFIHFIKLYVELHICTAHIYIGDIIQILCWINNSLLHYRFIEKRKKNHECFVSFAVSLQAVSI